MANTKLHSELFEKCLLSIKSDAKLNKLAQEMADKLGGTKEDFINGFASKAMRKTYPELY